MVLSDRYRKQTDLPHEVPLFPLREAILLPGATLPLNVFEPRYLAMVDDVLAGERLIGMIQPAGHEDEESPPGKTPPLRNVGCLGRVTSFQENDDGRLVIALTGISRFDLVDEAYTDKPYRIGITGYDKFADDLIRGHGEANVDRAALIEALRTYLDTNQLSTDWNVIDKAGSEFLVNALCIMSPYGAEEKQALLEAPDLKTRAEVLVALAEMELAARGGSGTLQ